MSLTYKLCRSTGKLKYPTEKEANKARMILWGKDPSVDLNDVHVYICPECKEYHVGHRSYYEKTKTYLDSNVRTD